MEQAPKAPENVESIADWESLRDSAVTDAAEMMSEADLDEMEGSELIAGLKGLLSVLVENGENKDRFAVEAIAQTIKREEAALAYKEATENLPLAA